MRNDSGGGVLCPSDRSRLRIGSRCTAASENVKTRICYWDNMKGFLILLVVFGHLLEQFPWGRTSVIYKFIYLFHMPLFVFCSGYLSGYSPRKIVDRLVFPYLVLQTVYCAFTSREIQVTSPFWGLWYLPALAVWRLTIPFLERDSKRSRLWVLGASLVFGCLAGEDNTIGYYGTLSRIIVFYPWFILGYYSKRYRPGMIKSLRKDPGKKVLSALALILGVGIFCFMAPRIDAKWLYEANSYESGGYSALFRVAHYLMGAVIGGFVLLVMPEKKTVFSVLGYNSFAIYVTHMGGVSLIGGVLASSCMSRTIQYILCGAASAAFCAAVAYGKNALVPLVPDMILPEAGKAGGKE